MTASHDDIPDLFSDQEESSPPPGRAAHGSAPPARRPSAPAGPRPSARPAPRPSVPPPAASGDGEGLGFELDYGSDPVAAGSPGSAGGADEMEFDPLSARGVGWGAPSATSPPPSLDLPDSRTTPAIEDLAVGVPSSRPGPSIPPEAARDSGPPPGFGNVAGEVDLGGFDDFDVAGASRAASLDVAVALPNRPEDDVPWPTGRTPHPEDMEFTADEIHDAAGFGATPSSVLSAPAYALRVWSAQGTLRERASGARRRFVEVEAERDERLARLAEALRPQLAAKDRFAALFSKFDRHDEEVARKTRLMQTADVEGATELKEVDARLEQLAAQRSKLERSRDQRVASLAEYERGVQRLRAQLRRLAIDERNLDKRFDKDELTEAQYYAQLAKLKESSEQLEQEIARQSSGRAQLAAAVEQAEDLVRVAVAESQGIEATKEGLLLAFEGAIAEHSRALDEAKRARRDDLAEAARVILELRGEVQVEADVRRAIAAADDVVAAAARDHELLRRASASVDTGMLNVGKGIWIGGVLFVVAVLLVIKLL